MALQKSFDDAHGSTHASAYHRVTSLHLDIEHKIAEWSVNTYKDSQARADGKVPVNVKTFMLTDTDYDTYFAPSVLDVVDQNPQERVYVYLKTLDEYDGASDV